jgi:hypothetical protein
MDVVGCANGEGSIIGDGDDATIFCKTKPGVGTITIDELL